MADIVDAFEQHHPFHSGLAEHIAIEPSQRAHAGDVAQHAVASDSHVGYADVRGCLVRRQTRGQERRPTVVAFVR